MGEEERALDLLRDAFKIFVIPRWQNIAKEAGLGFYAIPAEAEAIAINRRDRQLRRQTLLDQRILRLEQKRGGVDWGSRIGKPTAHGARLDQIRNDWYRQGP